MPLTNKQRGTVAERRIKAALEAAGCTVTRSPSSLGAADLLVRYNGKSYEVQVKYGKHPYIPPGERAALYDQAHAGGHLPVVALKVPRQRIFWYLVELGFGDKEHGLKPWSPVWDA